MKNVSRVNNILDFASMYDEAEAIWWIRNEHFPSTITYRQFTVMEHLWNQWIEKNANIVKTKHKIRTKDNRLSINTVVCEMKWDENIIFTFQPSKSNKGKMDIVGFSLYYSNQISPKFSVEAFDEEMISMKLFEEKKSQVYMVVQRHGSLDLQDFNITIPEMNIEMNYGKDWAEKHEELIEVLNYKKKKGIALLHGLPGTGKSMYIRRLISILSETKTVIYLPNQLIPCITDPGFIPLMAEYSGSILVIEDADEAIKSRKNGGATVDKLLNLADGILSDFLEMQIICTFNNDLSSIDDALLRKGRLILKHEFGKLDTESSQKLSDSLGFNTVIEDPMTLAEIYNQNETLSDIKKKESKIGFGR